MSKKKKKKKRGSKSTEASPPAELDGRSAARALKKALAESDAETAKLARTRGRDSDSATSKDRSKDDTQDKVEAAAVTASPKPAPRRRRPPTSMGEQHPRPKPPEVRVKVKKERASPIDERPSFFSRHDVTVLVVVALVLATGAILSRGLAETTPRRFDRLGLRFNRPALFLPPQPVEPPTDSVAADGTKLPYHVIYQSPVDPLLRLEVLIDERPSFNNLRATRALERAFRYGNMVWLKDSDDIKIGGRLWLRSEYQYAFKAGVFDSPKVATAVESATLNGALMYVVTFHGSEEAAEELANRVIGGLAVDPDHPAAQAIKE